MADGVVFSLEVAQLGGNALGEIHLHAAFRLVLEDLVGASLGALYDVLDGEGERMALPAAPLTFTDPVEPFDVGPGAPRAVVVYEDAVAERLAAAFPHLARSPRQDPEGLAFALGAAELALDPFGLAHLAPVVQAALEVARRAAPDARARLFTDDGTPVRAHVTSFAEQLAPLQAEPVAMLNGAEPRWLAFASPGAAAAFTRALPGLERRRLADLEALWRLARKTD